MPHQKHAASLVQNHSPHPHGEGPGQPKPQVGGVMEEAQERAREVGEHGGRLLCGAPLAQAFGAI